MSTQTSPLIMIRNLSIGYGNRVVLDRISLDIPASGILGIMGPSGVGKSALVRALTRQNDNLPNFWIRGEAHMNEIDLLSSPVAIVETRCPLLAQKARLYTGTVLQNVIEGTASNWSHSEEHKMAWARRAFETIGLWEQFAPLLYAPVSTLSMAKHKQILIARLMAHDPSCLFIDEPSPDIAMVEEDEILTLIESLGRRIPILLVTHNKQEAKRLCDMVCLITGGRLVEMTPKAQFFSAPQTTLGREFLQSGSCWPQDPTEAEAVEARAVAAPSQSVASAHRTVTVLRDFHWAIPELLAGMQQPGLLGNVEEDLAALKVLGVSVVVNLTERALYAEKLEAVGLKSIHFPIPDMGVPDLDAAVTLCRRVSAWMDLGQSTVLHCRAGMGRTGTMIACTLVYRGQGAIHAIEALRKINPRYIQTEEQYEFVGRFAKWIALSQAA